VSLNGFKDSQWDMKTPTMIQKVSSCQMVEIWKQLQKFVKFQPEATA
jgi:hypothetical protein